MAPFAYMGYCVLLLWLRVVARRAPPQQKLSMRHSTVANQ